MSSIIKPDDPLTWTRPKWNAMSCYINSALWGLLYNDSFIKIINRVDTAILTKSVSGRKCGPVDIDNLKTALQNYKHGILRKDNTINDALTLIRKILQDCSTNPLTKWDTQEGDSYEFLQIFNNLFINTDEEVGELINGDPTKSINGDPTKARNYVVTTTTNVTTVDKSSKLTDKNIYDQIFNTTPPISNITYQILPLISTAINATTGDMYDIANTQDGNDQIITVTDTSVIPRDISEDEAKKNNGAKYTGSNDGTIVENGINYIIINSSITTTQRYNLNNNNSGIVINYNMMTNSASGNGESLWQRTDNFIQDKYFRIGRYNLSAFSCTSPGHYTCYFMFNDKWYIMNDNPNETLLVDHTTEEFKHKLFRNSFLFFYSYNPKNKDNSNKLCSIEFDYDIKEKQREINAKLLSTPRSSSAPISSALSQLFTSRSTLGSSSSSGQTPYKDTLNVSPNQSNICEKYGDEWLNLFVSANASSGTIIHTTINGIPLSSVNVQANCTFVPGASPPLTIKPPPQQTPGSQTGSPSVTPGSQTGSPSVTPGSQTGSQSPAATGVVAAPVTPVTPPAAPKGPPATGAQITAAADADAALATAKTNLKIDNKSIPQNVLDNLYSKTTVEPNNIFKNKQHPPFNTLNFNDLVYDSTNKQLYMVVNITGQYPKKFLNLNNGKLYKNKLDSQNDTIYSGGTRKRNRNINGGKKTRKGKIKGKRHLRKGRKTRKGKRTRKHIRHKNKLKTNKLNTNKLRTIKA